MAMIAGLTAAIMKFMPDGLKDSLRYPIEKETLDGEPARNLAHNPPPPKLLRKLAAALVRGRERPACCSGSAAIPPVDSDPHPPSAGR